MLVFVCACFFSKCVHDSLYSELWTSMGCLFLLLATAIGLWSVTSCVVRHYKYTHFPPRVQKRPVVMGLPTRRCKQAWARCVGYRVWAASVGGVSAAWTPCLVFHGQTCFALCLSLLEHNEWLPHCGCNPVKRLFQPSVQSFAGHA